MTVIDTTAKSQTDSISFEFDLQHPPEKVWRALTDPVLLAEWLLPVVGLGLGLELEPGAAFTFEARPQAGWDGTVNCRFLEIEPHRKLSYTWVVGFGLDTVVTFTLTPTASGTRLSLVHSGFKPDQKGAFGGTRYGWRIMGGRLVDLLGSLPEAVNTASLVVFTTISPINAPPALVDALEGERDNVTNYVTQLPESPDTPVSRINNKEAAMRIKWTKVYVDDQEKALQFYTDKLGFRKKADFSQGNYRWLTVASAEDPDGVELQLESNANPAGRAYQEALRGAGQPAAQFQVNDAQAEHDRLAARGVQFTMPVTSATGSVIAVLDDTCGNLIQLVQLTWS